MKKISKTEKSRKKAAQACEHDFFFIDKWQDSTTCYWEFACRWCLDFDLYGVHLSLVPGLISPYYLAFVCLVIYFLELRGHVRFSLGLSGFDLSVK